MGALARHGFQDRAFRGCADHILDELDKLPPMRRLVQLRKIEAQLEEDRDRAKRDALQKQILEMGNASALLREEFESRAGFSIDVFMEKLKKSAREVPTPPLTSALNVEAATMGWAHFIWSSIPDYGIENEPDGTKELRALLDVLQETKDPALRRVYLSVSGTLDRMLEGAETDYLRFAHEWRQNSYARLEVGHKLAASLCLTDIPEDLVIQHPWTAWSLIVPDGLLGDLARIWIHVRPDADPCLILIDRIGHQIGKSDPVTVKMVASLVLGSALALSNPEDFRKDKQHRPTARSSKHRTGGAPDLGQARFMLSAPVSVDLREHVQEALSGKKGGGSPTVQFLVRGHWRQQAHGPARSLRKTLWIQPFWKGPEESRVLLRTYKAEDKDVEN